MELPVDEGGTVRRIAMVSLHTSPLEQPGSGDAGGLNVYVVELSRRLADAGIEVDIFTRGSGDARVPFADGITVVNVADGAPVQLSKEQLAAQVPAFSRAMVRAGREYDLIHSHYWLSGRAAVAAAHAWAVPLVHSMHTTARMKNLTLAAGDRAEPRARVHGEEFVVAHSDLLIANTDAEARHLVTAYGAFPESVAVVHPGVDLSAFRPRSSARSELGVSQDAVVVLFVGRLQPLKAPDVLLRAIAVLLSREPWLRQDLLVPIIGGPSGNGLECPEDLAKLATELGVADVVRFVPPLAHAELARWYAAADLAAVPSYSETFGLVALEAQAAGTPVIAAAVGGLRTAVRDGVSGLLVEGHESGAWAEALARGLRQRDRLAVGARPHAAAFSWEATASRMLGAYERVTSSLAIDEEMTA